VTDATNRCECGRNQPTLSAAVLLSENCLARQGSRFLPDSRDVLRDASKNDPILAQTASRSRTVDLNGALPSSANRRLRDKILRVVWVAGASISGGLRVRENWARANDFARGVKGFAEELIRSLAFLHPPDEREH
jgi:hypothetical protein